MPMIMPPMTLMKVMMMPAMASPRTNFEAPSMAPKKSASFCMSSRRRQASFSSIMPADRSASMAICLPGMASKVKRAVTSAIRVEPLVMTMKFTNVMIENTMTPMTKLLPMMKPPNASITLPAASVPLCPSVRIRRVDARLRARRNNVAISNTTGNELNSRARLMNTTVIKISTDSTSDIDNEISSSHDGSGMIKTTRISTIPNAKPRSPRLSDSPN